MVMHRPVKSAMCRFESFLASQFYKILILLDIFGLWDCLEWSPDCHFGNSDRFESDTGRQLIRRESG